MGDKGLVTVSPLFISHMSLLAYRFCTASRAYLGPNTSVKLTGHGPNLQHSMA